MEEIEFSGKSERCCSREIKAIQSLPRITGDVPCFPRLFYRKSISFPRDYRESGCRSYTFVRASLHRFLLPSDCVPVI